MLTVVLFPSDGYQTTDVWYSWNSRGDNTSTIFVDPGVELPQFDVKGVEQQTSINMYNIGELKGLLI